MKKLKTHEILRISNNEFKSSEKRKIIVWLDNIRSMNNIGSAFRTSDAFLIDKIILTGITAVPPHNEIHKTALGAEEVVDWLYFETNKEAIDYLRQNRWKIYSIEQAEGSVSLKNFKSDDENICVVFGNEVHGVADEIIDQSDGCLEIPQYGTKHSFNVSVTIGMVLWELCR